MATPHVAGTAALIWAARPQASVAAVRCDLLGTGAAVPALSGVTVTGRRLDAAAAVARNPLGGAAGGDRRRRRRDGHTARRCTARPIRAGRRAPTSSSSARPRRTARSTPAGSIGAGQRGGRGAARRSAAWPRARPTTTAWSRSAAGRGWPARTARSPRRAAAPPPVTPRRRATLTLKDVKVSCKRTGQRAQAHRALHAAPGDGRPPPQRAADEVRAPVRAGEREATAQRAGDAQGRAAPARAAATGVTLTLRDAKGAKRTKRLTVKV